ncbi:NYN domain-containing protein [Sulfitobacter sabulilitoris]|uniref:NYN domain-containing protein n=1 Tax=Sulfitobacter sabulilitoris TaxID=2562655 RepID=A0A5S3PKN4_9RHOB|nr:NYN domain-containing protein [Sulfitobacter sabulilitoris]TMM54816.1 NYN domain-containing protein [Sulfitobacter sabulilitoris]
MAERDRPLLAVLIDADNVPAKFASAILREVATIGEPALRRVYGDWSSGRLKNWSDQILGLGLVAHQETANTQGKNASDIGLVIDAMDILHGGRFDGFVLVSSDSDFTALANRLREDGLLVVGIGEKKAPEALRNVCNRFIFIENLLEEVRGTAQKADTETLNDAFQLIANAMEKIDQEGDWFDLGPIGKTILSLHPDFDTRSYGHSKLSALVKAIPRLETKREGAQLMVRRRD